MPREIDIVSAVGIFDPETASAFDLTATHLQGIEKSFGDSLQIGQMMTPRGLANVVSIPRNRVDILIEPTRLELRQQYPGTAIDEVAPVMAKLNSAVFEVLNVDPGEINWLRTGYNFNLTVLANQPAIEKLSEGLFDSSFTDILEYPLKGASIGVWLQVQDSVLSLKLEPYRSDTSEHKIAVIANFLEEGRSAPPSEGLETKLPGYLKELNDLLDRMGI